MTTTVVWIYWAGGARGDELRYSMRSVAANMTGDYRPCIIGDVPEWYTGDAIPLPRISHPQYIAAMGHDFMGRWRWCVDANWKFTAAAQCDAISDRYVVWFDETYLMHSTPIDHFLTPKHAGPFRRAARNRRNRAFETARRRTHARLKCRGLPTFDFGTHYPSVLIRSRWAEYSEQFRPLVSPAVFETQFINWAGIKAERLQPLEFQYQHVKRCRRGVLPSRFPHRVLNFAQIYAAQANDLARLFPNPAPWEC